MLYCTAFLLFDGNCAESTTFYHECSGAELRLTKPGDRPMEDMLNQYKDNTFAIFVIITN